MTRIEYIQLRVENRMNVIIYNYFIKKGKTKLSFEAFSILFDKWLLKQQEKSITQAEMIYNRVLEGIISFYDREFNIHYLSIERKVTTIETQKIIM